MAKILLIEDAKETRALLRMQLLSFQITDVTETSNGEEALVLIALGRDYDLILTDWQMKPMDGMEFCIEAYKHRTALGKPRIPIILLTADTRAVNPTSSAKAIGRDIGIVEILTKPITSSQLGAVISKHVKRPD